MYFLFQMEDTGTNMTMTIMSAAAEVSALTEPDMETLAKPFLPVPFVVPVETLV